MEIQVTQPDLVQGYDGSVKVSFVVAKEYAGVVRRAFEKLLSYPLLWLVVDKYREKRSLNANNYCWKLCDSIAKAVTARGKDNGKQARPTTKDDVYETVIRRYSECGESKIKNKDCSKFERMHRHYDIVSQNEKFTYYKFWVGSSQFYKDEMSNFLDGVVYEAQSVGIDTRTPDEIAKMKDLWEP